MTFIEALQDIGIQLAPGRVYHFEAEGYQIELRVGPGAKERPEPMDLEPDTMLDPWVEFPNPPGKPVRNIIKIDPPLPDIPDDLLKQAAAS